jgi:hypothetical protein
VATVYGVVGGGLDDEQRQRREALINEEITKRGIADRARVQVSESGTLLAFVPAWDTELNDAVDAGIDRFQAEG